MRYLWTFENLISYFFIRRFFQWKISFLIFLYQFLKLYLLRLLNLKFQKDRKVKSENGFQKITTKKGKGVKEKVKIKVLICLKMEFSDSIDGDELPASGQRRIGYGGGAHEIRGPPEVG